jgi:hypothetical protein
MCSSVAFMHQFMHQFSALIFTICSWLCNAIFPSAFELQARGEQEVRHAAGYLKFRLLDRALLR